MVIKEQVSASKKLGKSDALKMAKAASKVIAAKGKNVVSYSMAKDKPSDTDLAKVMLGPTGNMRAPTMRVGKTILVGFNQEAFEGVFG